jgi:hypothetical protein
MTLADLQRRFQAAVLSGEDDPALLAAMQEPPGDDRIETRFAIYSDGYRLRHAEFLANDFSALRETVGDEMFGAMVEAYIAARPSTFRNARWYSAGLPDFLRATPPFSDDPCACALAALEGALGQAFDADDAAPLAIDALATTPMNDWPALRFRLHPAAELVASSDAALAAYRAAQDEGAAQVFAGDEKRDVLVWRQALEVRYRALSPLETLALREIISGARFGDLCGLLAFARPEDSAEDLTAQAAVFLAQWFADGLIVDATTTESR